MGASVVAGRHASPVLEASEHARDEVSPPVEARVVDNGPLAAAAARDARPDAEADERFAQAVAVAALVGDESVGFGQSGQDGRRTAVVADLAFGQE